MGRKYANERDWKERIILDEIARHERAYANAQERYGWSTSNSGAETMRKHDVIANALSTYLRFDRERRAYRTKLSDIQDQVNYNLKRFEEGWRDGDLCAILRLIKAIAEREE